MTGSGPDQNAIPCDGCIECCKSEQVVLRPEAGDDLDLYDFVYVQSPLYPGRRIPALRQNPETGHCIYLTDRGCAIHENAPAICRRFHCARTFKALGVLSRAKRDAVWSMGNVLDQKVVERGRDRYRLAKEMGLDHVLDTEMQVAAFERLIAAPAPRKR